MRYVSIALILGFSLSACSKPLQEVHLRSVLDEASENELGPTARLLRQELLIRGIVEQTGLKKQSEQRHSSVVGLFGQIHTETLRTRSQYPYVIIAPEEGGEGRALCFFEMNDVDSIVRLKLGDRVRFKAKLQEFLRRNDQEVMVLACSVVP
jgi:hypothetical protein